MSLRATLLAAFAYALLVVLVVLEVPLVLNVSRRVDAEIRAESSGQAQLVATTAADELGRRAALQHLVTRASEGLGGRVVIVDERGRIVADSAGPGLRGAPYGDRPEIAQALGGETAQGRRRSTSLDEELLFTAVPVLRDGRPAGAVRVTQSVDAVNAEVRNDALVLVGAGAAALLLGMGVAWFLAGSLTRPLETLAETAHRVAEGDLAARAPEEGSREQREVAAAFNEMTSRLEGALGAQRDFVANASHQLRTPLTGLRLRLEAAGEVARDPAVSEEVRAAEAEVERLAGLLGNLLVLAREGQARPDPRPVDLAGACREAKERWEADAAARGHRLELRGEGEVIVAASHDDVGIVLDNLLENAIKYSPRGSAVAIDWRADRAGPGTGVLAVLDQGPGLASGEEGRVLERFFRGDASAGESGTGLGLAIVAAIARRWSGAVELRNLRAAGLRAEVRFPLADQDLRFPDDDFAGSLPEPR